MSIYCQKDTTVTINPRSTLALCDRCGENPPRFLVGHGVTEVWLCALCGVHQDLYALSDADARALQAQRLHWIGTPNPETDVDDETFAATHYQDPARLSADDDVMVERVARMEFVTMLEEMAVAA